VTNKLLRLYRFTYAMGIIFKVNDKRKLSIRQRILTDWMRQRGNGNGVADGHTKLTM